MTAVASIELDRPDRARGYICVRPVEVYDSDPGHDHPSPPDLRYEVAVFAPEGEFSSVALPDFETEAAARAAIQASWGQGGWDLQWESDPGILPPADLAAAIAWYNAQTPEVRGQMLASEQVRADPTPHRCWLVFGPARKGAV